MKCRKFGSTGLEISALIFGGGVVGGLRKEIPSAQRPHISTKMVFDRKAGDVAGQAGRSLAQSLERLQMDSVELFQVHNLTPQDMLGHGGVADALDRLVASNFR